MHHDTTARLAGLLIFGALTACGGGDADEAPQGLEIPKLVKKNGFPTEQQNQALPLLTPTTLWTDGGKVAETFDVYLVPENPELVELLATIDVERVWIGTLGDTFEPAGVLEVDGDDDGPINVVGDLVLRDLGLPTIPATWRVFADTDAQLDAADAHLVIASGFAIGDVTLPLGLEAPDLAVSLDTLLPILPNLFEGSDATVSVDGFAGPSLTSADSAELSGAVAPELVELPGTLTIAASASSFVNADLGVVTLSDEASVELPNLSPGRHWTSAAVEADGDGTLPLAPVWTLTTGEVEDEVLVFREATSDGAAPRGDPDAMVPGRTRFFVTDDDGALTEVYPGVFVEGEGEEDGSVESVDVEAKLQVAQDGTAIVPVFFDDEGDELDLADVFDGADLDDPAFVPPAALRLCSEEPDGTFPSLLTVQPILRGDLGLVDGADGDPLWPEGVGAAVRLADGLRLEHDPALLAEFVIEPLGFEAAQVVDVEFVIQAFDGVAWSDVERVSLGGGTLEHATTSLAGLPVATPVRFWAILDLSLADEDARVATERYDAAITRPSPVPAG